MIPIEGHKNLYRDENTGAILNADNIGYNNYLKLIIFSEESYNDNSYDSVLNCGELNKDIEASGSFNPNYYIMTTYNGNHYKSIDYKDKKKSN